MAAGFQADKELGLVAELAQAPFKGRKTFSARQYFEGLEQHIAATIDCRSAVEALSKVDTNEDVEQIVGGGQKVSFMSFLFWGCDGRPASHTCG